MTSTTDLLACIDRLIQEAIDAQCYISDLDSPPSEEDVSRVVAILWYTRREINNIEVKIASLNIDVEHGKLINNG